MENITGLIVGRFQTPYLHEGHLHLINTVIQRCDQVVIILGCTNSLNDRNPYSRDQVQQTIWNCYPHIKIECLYDEKDYKEWVMYLENIANKYYSPKFFGSRDSFIKMYKGNIPYEHIEEIPDVSATKIRESLKNQT